MDATAQTHQRDRLSRTREVVAECVDDLLQVVLLELDFVVDGIVVSGLG